MVKEIVRIEGITMEQTLRKAKSDLALSGVGAAAFGVWGFAKTILYNLFAGGYVTDMFAFENISNSEKRIILILWCFTSFITMLLHLYVGLCTVFDGIGRKIHHRRLYLFLAWAVFLGNGWGLIYNLISFSSQQAPLLDRLCNVMMEAVRVANLAALLRASRRVRQLTQDERKAAEHAD